jgi:peptide/nickel transport system permease protein
MLIEAGLSYLGLGVPPPHATWGNLIAGARPALGQAWWVAVFPGLMLTGAVLSFNVAADNLRGSLARR